MDFGRKWSRERAVSGKEILDRTFTFPNNFDDSHTDVGKFNKLPVMVQEEALAFILSSGTLKPDEQIDIADGIVRDPAATAPAPLSVTVEHADALANSYYDSHKNERIRSRAGNITWQGAHPVNRLISGALLVANEAKKSEDTAFVDELVRKTEKNKHPFLADLPTSVRGDVRRMIEAAVADADPRAELARAITAFVNPDFSPVHRGELQELFEVEYAEQAEGLSQHGLNILNFISSGKREGAARANRQYVDPTAESHSAEGSAGDVISNPMTREVQAASGGADFLNDEGVVGVRIRGEILRAVDQFFTPLVGRLQQLTLNQLVANSFVVGTNTKVGHSMAKMIAHIQAGNRAHPIRNRDIRVLLDNGVAVGEQLTAIATGVEDMLQRADRTFIENIEPAISPQEESLLRAELLRSTPRTTDQMIEAWWNPARLAGMPPPGTAVTGVAGRSTPRGCQLPLNAFQPIPRTKPGIVRASVPSGQFDPSRVQQIAGLLHRYLTGHGRDRGVMEILRNEEIVPMTRADFERKTMPETEPSDDVERRIRELLNM